MKAVKLLEYGGQLVFDDVPTPSIAGDEVLVRIKSTAVTHLDIVEASGTWKLAMPVQHQLKHASRGSVRRQLFLWTFSLLPATRTGPSGPARHGCQ